MLGKRVKTVRSSQCTAAARAREMCEAPANYDDLYDSEFVNAAATMTAHYIQMTANCAT